MKNKISNPLLQFFDTVPFSKIKNEHFKPAFLEAITIAKNEVQKISRNLEPPTFENTLVALELSGSQLDRISGTFFNLNSAETNEQIQQIAQEVSPLLSEFSNDITLNERLFKRIAAVYAQKEQLTLSTEEHTLLEKRYKSFTRNGANLPADKKIRLREIDAVLAKGKPQFGEHVLAATNAFELHLTDENDLNGLPESAKEAAAQVAKSKEKDGWVITLDYPSYIPFMKYAEHRELRKKLALAFGGKAFNDQYDNQEQVLKLVRLRHERAQLLGYATHAHFVLEERMAETPDNVLHFLNELLDKAKPAAQR